MCEKQRSICKMFAIECFENSHGTSGSDEMLKRLSLEHRTVDGIATFYLVKSMVKASKGALLACSCRRLRDRNPISSSSNIADIGEDDTSQYTVAANGISVTVIAAAVIFDVL